VVESQFFDFVEGQATGRGRGFISRVCGRSTVAGKGCELNGFGCVFAGRDRLSSGTEPSGADSGASAVVWAGSVRAAAGCLSEPGETVASECMAQPEIIRTPAAIAGTCRKRDPMKTSQSRRIIRFIAPCFRENHGAVQAVVSAFPRSGMSLCGIQDVRSPLTDTAGRVLGLPPNATYF